VYQSKKTRGKRTEGGQDDTRKIKGSKGMVKLVEAATSGDRHQGRIIDFKNKGVDDWGNHPKN